MNDPKYRFLLDEALRLFDGADGAHFNCAQSVFMPFARQAGLEEAVALRLASPMGGGIARRGEHCGASLGALLTIGLLAGRDRLEDVARGDRCIALSRRFVEEFSAAFGHSKCSELLGVNIALPEGRAEIRARRLHETQCREFVKGAVETLIAFLEEGELTWPE